MSPQDLGVLLRQLWLYTRLAPLGRQLVQTKQRPDSLRHHVENQHLLFSRTDPVSCSHRVCSDTGVPTFPNREVWLNHATIVHQYDLKIQLHRLASIL